MMPRHPVGFFLWIRFAIGEPDENPSREGKSRGSAIPREGSAGMSLQQAEHEGKKTHAETEAQRREG